MPLAIEETNAATVRTFLETLSSGDLDRVAPLFEPDAIWTVCASGIPGAGSHHGGAIFEEFLGPVRGLFEPGQPKVEVTNLVAQGSWVAVEATGRGRFRNGTDYENHYSFWIEVSGDLIRTVREYMDSQYVASLVD
jgi:ketosteroid isomerase-like protein